MSERAWGDVIEDLFAGRAQSPREAGLTMVIDKGWGLTLTHDLIEGCGDYIDHWKCTFGTSTFVPADVLSRKLRHLNARGILTYPGGTLLEVALVRGKCRAYMQRACDLGFNAVEISDGTIPMPAFRRHNAIRYALEHGLTPITEVGKKDPAQQPTALEMAEQALQDLEWGAKWVTVEARESGKGVGIYDDNGMVRAEMIAAMCERMEHLADRLIWEAPQKNQQTYLIRHFGPNANLGNVPPGEVLALEALRVGLRFETFAPVVEELQQRGEWDPSQVEEMTRDGRA
jgi:phosphosulfolactate synthase